MTVVITAFYKFTRLQDCDQFRTALMSLCSAQGIKGTILLAPEGINGTIAGSELAIATVLAWLKSDERLADLEHKDSLAESHPFYHLKVRLKPEIISLGIPSVDPTRQVGTYVASEDWNRVISDPDVVLIDTRNDYEVSIGTFKGAIDPKTDSFRQFPVYVKHHLDPARDKKVAMFCTGGIRCEKASAYLLQQGFETVYHLKGGILKYLEEVPAEKSLWQGECFVFDQRVAVGHGLAVGTHELCHGCGRPVSPSDRTSPQYQPGICCPFCADSLSAEQHARFEERQRQIALARQRGEQHLGRQ
jgi:UPF0176 protein